MEGYECQRVTLSKYVHPEGLKLSERLYHEVINARRRYWSQIKSGMFQALTIFLPEKQSSCNPRQVAPPWTEDYLKVTLKCLA